MVSLYITFMVFIVGLIIGSFLNVVILRSLKGESIVFPPSHCPKCKTQLKSYDNIPVLSWLILGGKCRYCKEKISIQYPIVELITGILFVLIFLKTGFSFKTLFLFYFAASVIVMSGTDIKEKLISDWVSIPLIFGGLFYNLLGLGNIPFIVAFLSAVVGALAFELISRLGYVLVGERAFGEGDTIIIAALGAWFGWQKLLIIFVMSVVVQSIIGIPCIIYNMYSQNDYKSILAVFTLLLSAIIPLAAKFTGIMTTPLSAFLVMILSLTIALISMFRILRRAKETQNYTVLPFGPALLVSGLIMIFLNI